jgi:hypothetical protein
VTTDARLGACCARETTRWPVKVRDWVRAAMVTVFLGMTLQDKKVAVLASKICQLEERIPTSFSFMTKYSYPTFALLKT